jgi:hypothetical protein
MPFDRRLPTPRVGGWELMGVGWRRGEYELIMKRRISPG